ncbi:MAG: thioredoxin family protein [Spirochaetes bacterium]|nr:thioredoxin family protein [Spirochaetota bacterium]
MKKIIIMFLIASVLLSCKDNSSTKNVKGVNWLTDVDKANELAGKENKLIMIDVYADWCSWCTKLDEETYIDKDVIKESKKFVNLKINPETDQKASEYLTPYKISGFPTILFVEPNGQLVDSIGGFLDAKAFLERMKNVFTVRDKFTKLMEEYKSDNFENSSELLDILLKSSRFDEALPIFEKLNGKNLIKEDKLGQIYMGIGNYYGQMGDFPKAKEYFAKLLDYKADDEVRYSSVYYYALALLLNNEIDAAKLFIADSLKGDKLSEEWKNYLKQLETDYFSNAKE